MKIKALVPWFGSKRTLAPEIVRQLGPHRAYWEPFCGSMSVLFAKPECSAETVNDLNGELINLARTIQHNSLGPALYRRLRRTLMHEDFFTEAAERFKARGWQSANGHADLDRASDFFLCCWLGRNGVAGTQSYNQGYCVRYTKNGGHGSTRYQSVIDSIPAFRARLRNVVILNRDAFELLDRIDDADGVAMYIDPPYLEKGAKYIHDFEKNDHERLALALGRFTKTRVVVSYYADPRLAELYSGWTVHDCAVTKALVNQGRRDKKGATVAPEVLMINGPAYGPSLW